MDSDTAATFRAMFSPRTFILIDLEGQVDQLLEAEINKCSSPHLLRITHGMCWVFWGLLLAAAWSHMPNKPGLKT